MNTLDEAAGLHRFPLARRSVLTSGLIAGLTLATTTVEAQAIHTDSAGMVAGEVEIPTGDGGIPGYFARPDGAGPFPIVLVVEEVFGVHEYLKDVCRRFAKAGYLAVAPEIYARQGDISKVTDIGQIMSQFIAKTPDVQVMSDLDATADWAARNHGDATRLGVNGFCRGGRETWLYAAHNPRLKAAVSWYGQLGGSTSDIQPVTAIERVGAIDCPVLGLYGGKDASAPAALLRDAEARAKAAGKTVEIVLYPEVGHAFHADYRPSYNREAAEDGWRRALAWFQKYEVG